MEYFPIVLCMAILAALAMAVRRFDRLHEHEWHSDVSFWHGPVMRRRRPDGSWEQRAMTAAEEAEDNEVRM